MRLPALLAACILVIPAYTTAQTAAADGVQAFLRGDNQAAIRILTPLAEGQPDADPVAAFFLALAYQSSPGWSGSMRVCGLFRRADTATSPVALQARVLAETLGGAAGLGFEQCMLASRRGWGQPEWTAFTLAARHRVRIDADGFQVEYDGASKRTRESWGGPGWQFLPIRLTELATLTSGQDRRYFIELFVWAPHSKIDVPEWALLWFAFEVSGADVVRLDGNGLVARFTGSMPPSSFPIDDYARFVVSDNGSVERVVVGPEARQIPVPARSSR